MGAGGAAAGLLVDRLLGEPPAALHPLRGFGAAMAALERATWSDARGPGVAYAAAGALAGAAAGATLRSTTAATALAVGGRALWEAARGVGEALEVGDLERARSLVPTLAGRDPSGLDASEVARAVVESVAENTVDAVVAPALWAALAGAPGALAYRAVNTLDAMVGHRSERYLHYGWASARLDDLAGWVPARLTAALVLAVRPGAAGRLAVALRTQAPWHPSPNAGVAEAAFAAALGITLGGVNVYGSRAEERPPLGTGPRPAPSDIARAVRLSSDVSWALTGALAAAGAARRVSGRRLPARGRGW